MIVCLGWGSLIWREEDLPVRGGWHNDGPVLPLEFARRSGDGRITLVVCDQGIPCPTLWSELEVADVAAARSALAEREGLLSNKYAAFWSPDESSGHLGTDAVAAWAMERQLDGVVWTGLPPKSPATNTNGDYPTGEEVLAHLQQLQGESLTNAEEYFRRAPAQIRTAYRDLVEQELGWMPEG